MTINLKKTFFFSITGVFFIIANIITLNFNNIAYEFDDKWIVMLLYCLVVIFIYSNFEKSITKEKLILLIIWCLFFLSIFLSKLLHGDFNFLEFALYILFIPSLFFLKTIVLYKYLYFYASMLAFLPFFVVSESGNSIGILLCFFGILLINILYEKQVNFKFVILIISIICIFIFLTESRTSLITFFSISLLYISKYFMVKAKSFGQILRKLVFFTLIIVILLAAYSYLENLLLNKWSFTNENLTSNRSEMWLNTLKTGITLFGNGEEYFYNTYFIRDGHNTLIQVMGAYGSISLTLILILFFYITYKCIKVRKVEYIAFLGGYFILGLAENLLFIDSRLLGINLLFFVFLVCLFNEKNKYPAKY